MNLIARVQIVLLFAGCAWTLLVEDGTRWKPAGSLFFVACVLLQFWPQGGKGRP